MNRTPRVFIPRAAIRDGVADIPSTEAHHLLRVLRMRSGQSIHLFDEQGSEYDAEIHSIDPRRLRATARVVSTREPTGQAPSLHLAVGVLKGRKLDEVIRRAAALGVTSIRPFVSRRSIPKAGSDSTARTNRWSRLVIESAKLSPGLRPPLLYPVRSFNDVIEELSFCSIRLFLFENATRTLTEFFPERVSANRDVHVALLLGSEGGFSETEVSLAERRGYSIGSLGRIILRSELASDVALILTLHRLGVLG